MFFNGMVHRYSVLLFKTYTNFLKNQYDGQKTVVNNTYQAP